MVTLSDAFPSKYLKATDLPDPVIATIKLAEQYSQVTREAPASTLRGAAHPGQ